MLVQKGITKGAEPNQSSQDDCSACDAALVTLKQMFNATAVSFSFIMHMKHIHIIHPVRTYWTGFMSVYFLTDYTILAAVTCFSSNKQQRTQAVLFLTLVLSGANANTPFPQCTALLMSLSFVFSGVLWPFTLKSCSNRTSNYPQSLN